MTKTKVVIYTRVSSQEQVANTSLGTQKRDCINHAAEKNLEVATIFEEEGESAKFTTRPKLQEMLVYIENHKKELGALIVWKLDRLSRNIEDYYFIRRILGECGVKIISVSEPRIEEDTITSKILENFSSLQAEIDNIDRRNKSVRGMQARILEGIYPWKAPIGYRPAASRIRGDKKLLPDEVDPERAHILKKIFRSFLDDNITSTTELAEVANKFGLTTSTGKRIRPQTIDRVLRNPFYAGILVDEWSDPPRNLKGAHTPLISQEEYHQIQDTLNNPRRKKVEFRRKENPNFPLRGSIICSDCSKALTGSYVTGNGGKYPYYWCNTYGCAKRYKNVRKKTIENAFLQKIKDITPSEKTWKFFEIMMSEIYRKRKAEVKNLREEAQSKIKTLDEKKAKLVELRMENSLNQEEFLSHKGIYDKEIAEAKAVLANTGVDNPDLESLLERTRTAIQALPEEWFGLSLPQKKRFQKLIFPEGIAYQVGHGFGTAKLGLVYSVLGGLSDQSSPDVSPGGIEPPSRD